MKINIIKSPAKINLALNVIGKSRSLHKVESLVSFINLFDLISVKEIKEKKHRISFDGLFSKNIKKKNTISKLLNILDKKIYLMVKISDNNKKKHTTRSRPRRWLNKCCKLNFLFSKKKNFENKHYSNNKNM